MLGFFIVLFFSTTVFAQQPGESHRSLRPSPFSPVLQRVSQGHAGDFILDFDRLIDTDSGDRVEHVRLVDYDGIATLLSVQSAIVGALRQKGPYQMDFDLRHLLTPAQRSAISVQKDALKKLLTVLEAEVDRGKGRLPIAVNEMSISAAVVRARELLGRYDMRTQWTVQDVENLGNFIRGFRTSAGPYTVTYNLEGSDKVVRQKEMRLWFSDEKLKGMSFLNGITSQNFVPSRYMNSSIDDLRLEVVLGGNFAGISSFHEAVRPSPNVPNGVHFR